MEFKLPKRDENSNKGSFGKILNVAGSKYMPGAAVLSSLAALRTGAGFVVLASEQSVLDKISIIAPEVVLAPFTKIKELFKEVTVLSIGCGLSTENYDVFNLAIMLRNDLPTVIDADGLNILAQSEILLDKNTILTPHPREASRLLGCSLEKVLEDIEIAAKKISEKYNCVTVLKSHRTVVTDGELVYKNTTGNSALAKAGSGDVLCGIISGLLAQKMNVFEAACLGVYLHGLAGEFAAKSLSEYGVLASDTIRHIPFAINYLLTKDV